MLFVGLLGGVNLYAFCRNASSYIIDLLGLQVGQRDFGITYVQINTSGGHGWIRLGEIESVAIQVAQTNAKDGQFVRFLLPKGVGFYPTKKESGEDYDYWELAMGVKGMWQNERDKEIRLVMLNMAIKEWKTVVKSGTSDYLFGQPKKCCRDVTKYEVISCILNYVKKHASDEYRLPHKNCRTRAKEALEACCLQIGEEKKEPLRGVSSLKVRNVK